MTHIMSDEEFAEYKKIKKEWNELQHFRANFNSRCVQYFEEGKTPCSNSNYVCDFCPINDLAPKYADQDRCPVGRIKHSK